MSTHTTEQHKHLVRRETAEIQNRNYGVIDDLYAEEVTIHVNRTGSSDPVVSRDDPKQLYREWGDAFPDLTIDITAEAAEGDVVMAQVTIRGTHEGRFRGVDPTGQVIDLTGFHMRRFADGKIVETSSVVSMGRFMEQLGLDVPLTG